MLITEAYKEDIWGSLFCYDRVNINATAGTFGYADGMTQFFYANKFKIFDFHNVFTPVTEKIIKNAEKIEAENNLKIEYISKTKSFRKDDKIAEIVKNRGSHEGIVHIFSQQETYNTYTPWHDKNTHKTYFKNDTGKGLVYYFYFIDRLLGLCFIKVPTKAPFKVVVYYNGHNWLEQKMINKNIPFKKQDNAFLSIENFEEAQKICNSIRIPDLHQALNILVKRFCPLPEDWNLDFNFTISQVEYALDIVFKDKDILKHLYENIVKTAMHTITPENIANFLGKRFSNLFEGESGTRYNNRILGTRIKHQMGEISVKIYDKFGSVLRIEVTCLNVSKISIFRDVQKRDGTIVPKVAPAPKSIYSLYPLMSAFKNIIHRYLEYISSFDDPSDGIKKLDSVTEDVVENDRKYKGFNFFNKSDEEILLSIADGKYSIHGLTNKELRKKLTSKTSGQISRILKRLLLHGLIKKVRKTYRYHLTSIANKVLTAGFKFKNLTLIPDFARF
ncbi:TPA: MarR family transcriptional regulator [Candidatus Magasanikbacteria bacterium]|nr:MarR family transcriptional regulator [Candidatus Magasanikbacteria bacterium]